MEFVWIIGKQLITMFLYIAIGFILFKGKLISQEGSKSIANLLLYVILPCVVLKSFQVERTAETTADLLMSMALGGAVLLLAMAVSALVFRKAPMDNFGCAFSNAGFMGFPLVTAALGSEATFYAVGFVAFLNVFQWTYGQWLLSGDAKQIAPKAVLKNPIVISLFVGLILYFTACPLPGVVTAGMAAIAGMNAPIAMVILGVYLAQADLVKTLVTPRLYLVSTVRLVLIPLLTLAVLWPLSKGAPQMTMAIFLVAAAPVGSNIAVYAQKLGKDYRYAVGLVCVSTVLCLVTMPILAGLAQNLFVG